MQGSTAVNAQDLCGFLELLLIGFVVLTMIIILLLLVTAPSGPLLLVILAAAASSATTLLAGHLSTVLALLLVSPFILSFLPF